MVKPTEGKPDRDAGSRDALIKQLSRKNELLQSAVKDLTLLNEMALKASRSQNVDKTLDMILEKSVMNLNAEQGSILLLADGNTDNLKTLLRQQDRRSRIFTTKVGSNITGWVLHNKQPLRIDNLATDTRFKTTQQEKEQIRSALCVPLMYKGDVLGILMVVNKKVETHFNESDLRLLGIVATQSGQIIRNLQLQEEAVKQEREKNEQLQKLNDAYGRFVPHEFLKFLGKQSILDVRLGDNVELDVTIFVSDIRSFTSISEKMTPVENFRFINDYLAITSPIIREHGGVINRYTGDAIMALFPNNSDDGVKAAIATLKQLAKNNAQRKKNAKFPIRIGVGIHTGRLMLGIVGDGQRTQGDIFSDAVNTANRVEGLTKRYGVSLLVSQQALDNLSAKDDYNRRFLGRVQVKGKQEYVQVYEIYDGDEKNIRQAKLQTKADFEEGLQNYFNRDFTAASVSFKRVMDVNPDDKTARLYLEHSAQLMIQGVPDNWEGVEFF